MSMLVAYTHTDPDSLLMKAYALTFLELAGTRKPLILKPRATSAASIIRTELGKNPQEPFFFFGHGQEDQSRTPPYFLVAQDGQAALDERDGKLLQDRLVVALCCFGLDALGATSNSYMYNATIFGYQGTLELIHDSEYVFDLEDCLMAGLKELLAGKTAGDALNATQKEYARVITRLGGSAQFNDQLVCYNTFDPNSKRVDIAGDRRKTI
jgi:hypothetical protein